MLIFFAENLCFEKSRNRDEIEQILALGTVKFSSLFPKTQFLGCQNLVLGSREHSLCYTLNCALTAQKLCFC